MAKLSKLQGSYFIALITAGHQAFGSRDHAGMMTKIGGQAEPDSETIPKCSRTFQEFWKVFLYLFLNKVFWEFFWVFVLFLFYIEN